MAVITSGLHPKEKWPGIKKIFGHSYEEKPLRCEMIFDVVSSDKSYEEYLEQTGFGLAPIKPEGNSVQYDTDGQGYLTRATNVTYALGAMATEEAIADNQYFSVMSQKAKKLARSMRQTKENVCANILNRGFNSSYVGGDGVELFSLAHPTVNGTQANELAVAADLSEASLEDMLTLIRNAVDSRGLRIQAMGAKLITAAENEFNATRILESSLRSGTDHNDVNAVKQLGMLPGGVVVNEYLTDPDAWFIKTDVDNGLMLQNRKALSLDQDNDFDTSNARMKASERYAAFWADWRGVYGSAGA